MICSYFPSEFYSIQQFYKTRLIVKTWIWHFLIIWCRWSDNKSEPQLHPSCSI